MNIGIVKNRIAAISPDPFSAVMRINCDGKKVIPGFIDVHSHTDEGCMNPSFDSKISQGIVAEISGNCGGSPFPFPNTHSQAYRKRLKIREDNWYTERTWQTYVDYKQVVNEEKSITNQFTLVGWWTLWDALDTDYKGIDDMLALLNACLEQGCPGLSINQGTLSWSQFSFDDKLKIMSLLYRYDAILTVHLRDYSRDFIPSLKEIMNLWGEYPIRIELSHMKFLNPDYHTNLDYLYRCLDRGEGLIHFDLYPYTSICTNLKNIVTRYSLNDIEKVRLLNNDRSLNISIQEERAILLRLSRKEPYQLVEADGIPPSCVKELIRYEGCFIGTDYMSCKVKDTNRCHHPRACFTFQKAFRLLRELGVSPETIIKRFSMIPAAFFRIHGKRKLSAGDFADICVVEYDKELLKISMVILNGKISYKAAESFVVKNGIAID